MMMERPTARRVPTFLHGRLTEIDTHHPLHATGNFVSLHPFFSRILFAVLLKRDHKKRENVRHRNRL